MKKILTTILALSLLVGCSAGTGAIKDADTKLVEMNGQTITKGMIYDMMVNTNGVNQIVSDSVEYIIESEISDMAQIEKEAGEMLIKQKEAYGDMFQAMISMYGYKNEQEFMEKTIIPQLKTAALVKKYLADHLNTVAQYSPKKVQIMSFKDEAKAKEAKADLDAGKAFETVATEKESTLSPEVMITTTISEYPLDVKLFIQDSKELATSDIIADEENKQYYIVKLIDIDYNNFKEEAIETVAPIQDVTNQAVLFFFKQHGLKVYDTDLHDQLQSINPDYLAN